MNCDDGVDVGTVAAAHRDDDGNAAGAAFGEDEAVAFGQSIDRELQFAQPVGLVGIGAGEIKHDVWSMAVEHIRQMRGESVQVFGVAGAVVKGDVEVAELFAEWKIVRAVQRDREDRRFVVKDCCGAVALMHVAIDDGGAHDRAIAQQNRRRDRDVVENAVGFTAVAKGMVRAAGEVGGDAGCATDFSRRGQRGADRAAGAS